MTRFPSTLTILAVLVTLTLPSEVHSRAAGVATERPWAKENIERLPPDIRRDIEGHANTCNSAPAATHYFSLSIEASGLRFYAQHFENFACQQRHAVCRPQGCLHEVFIDDGRRQRHVFSVYARDITLTNHGGAAGVTVIMDDGTRSLIWNGRSFVPGKSTRKR